MQALTPHLTLRDCAKYIDFLKAAFDAEELGRAPGPSGKLMHAELNIFGSRLMLHDHFPDWGMPPIAEGHWPVTLNLYVPDCDATFKQALAAGCTEVMPLGDQFWGDRYGKVKDPFGFEWAIATHKETLTPEEIEARQKAMFGGGASA